MRPHHRTPRRRRALISRGRKRRRRLLAAAALLLLAFGASQTFASSNTVPATYAGAGTQAVTTPTYSNVKVLPNRDNPQLIRQVTFTTSAAAATYTISTGGAFTSCANASGAVTCTAIAGAALGTNTQLTIRAR